MRKTLYLKFVLGYLIFGFFGFLVVATFVSSMTLEHLKREKADSLYKEATPTYTAAMFPSRRSKNSWMRSAPTCPPKSGSLIHPDVLS